MDTTTGVITSSGDLAFSRPRENSLALRLAGDWTIGKVIPSPEEVQKQVDSGQPLQRITFDTNELGSWDSVLITFLLKVFDQCSKRQIDVDRSGLPEGVRRLLDLAAAVPEKKDARKMALREPFLVQVGKAGMDIARQVTGMTTFLGEATIAFGRFLVGKAKFRRTDLWLTLQQCGADALPIVSLISFLVGLILAFVGAVQLALFGAQIYIANLVGIAMAREMGAIMTAIIMAGRTGAAFAAQIGTMQVNEEVDALTTMGISPMEFLVLPRMLALILMMPLLCLYSDLVGILGGFVVGTGMFDISFTQYMGQTKASLNLTQFGIGVFKSAIYGVVVAITGCLRGMECGRSASAVGDAATSAVVTSIVLIIVLDGIFAVVTNIIGI
ncbi:MAG: ABC transporter permease [Deltaproteobacteria bacterium]|nr:ABC transporter permease [Deltaproteobacteria bacterium]